MARQDDKKGKKTEDEELEIVGDGAEDEDDQSSSDSDADVVMVGDPNEDGNTEEDDKDDEDKDDETDDDEDKDGDEGDEKEERKLSPNAEKRRRKKERKRREAEQAAQEIAYLRARNEQFEERFGHLETRTQQNEVAAVDQRLIQLKSQLEMADEVIAEATSQGKGDHVVKANKIKDGIKEKMGRLIAARQHLVQQASRTQNQPSTRVKRSADNWVKANSWYDPDPKTQDKDSRRVKRIDDRLMQEGFDPETEEYWDELTERVQAAFPDKYKKRKAHLNGRDREDDDEDEADEDDDDSLDDDEDEAESNRKPAKKGKVKGPTFRTGGREIRLKPGQVHISAARKAAMIEAGVWDDPTERARYLKQYAKYDKEHSARR